MESARKCLAAIMLITSPLIFAIVAGEIVGIIWLLIIGKWQIVLGTIIIGAFLPNIFVIPMLLLNLLNMGVVFIAQKIVLIKWPLLFIVLFVNHLLFVGWAILILDLSIRLSIGHNPIPFILCGWGFAVYPFKYMTDREPEDDIASPISLCIITTAYFVLGLSYLFNVIAYGFIIILLMMVLMEISSLILNSAIEKANQQSPYYSTNKKSREVRTAPTIPGP